MTTLVEKIEIQKKLHAMAVAGPFYKVFHVAGNRAPTSIDLDGAAAQRVIVPPASAVSNETQASFNVDDAQGRNQQSDRESWSWTLIVQFDVEVTAYAVEELWQTTPQRIPRSASIRRQIDLELDQAVYTHPTRQQSRSGTRIEFTFNARLSRR